jgi:hypothetical protein
VSTIVRLCIIFASILPYLIEVGATTITLGRVRFARSRTLLTPSDVAINGPSDRYLASDTGRQHVN